MFVFKILNIHNGMISTIYLYTWDISLLHCKSHSDVSLIPGSFTFEKNIKTKIVSVTVRNRQEPSYCKILSKTKIKTPFTFEKGVPWSMVYRQLVKQIFPITFQLPWKTSGTWVGGDTEDWNLLLSPFISSRFSFMDLTCLRVSILFEI